MGSPRAICLMGGWVVSAGVGVACGVVLNPERMDDVIRCGTSGDCPKPENNRYIAVCKYGDEFGEGDPAAYQQVCVAEFDSKDCSAQGKSAEFTELWLDATMSPGMYIDGCDDALGGQGCLPGTDGCQAPLRVHPVTKLCDDEDAQTFPAVGRGLDDFIGLDVQDQFCKSYFCDPDFVCDRTKGQDRCVKCVPGGNFGRGGCYDVYVGGERSPVYLSDVENRADCPAQAHSETVNFGTFPEPP